MILQIKNFTKQKINKKHLDKIVEETFNVTKTKTLVEISLVIVG